MNAHNDPAQRSVCVVRGCACTHVRLHKSPHNRVCVEIIPLWTQSHWIEMNVGQSGSDGKREANYKVIGRSLSATVASFTPEASASLPCTSRWTSLVQLCLT